MAHTANEHDAIDGLRNLPYAGSRVGDSYHGSGSPHKAIRINGETSFKPTLLQARQELHNTMHGKINLTPMESLMKDFLPSPRPRRKTKTTRNIFSDVPDFSSERKMYGWLVERLNSSKLFPNHLFVATPYKADPVDPTRQAIDCGMYHKKLPPKEDLGSETAEMTYNRRVNWSRLEMGIECKLKRTDQDPFDDRSADGEPVAAARKKALGQILSYAELVFKHQQRTSQFMVLFLSHYARVVHFDRAGVYTTHKFCYKTEGALLSDFLVRYSRLQPEHRGLDTTAQRIEADSPLGLAMVKWGEDSNAEDHVKKLFKNSLDSSWAWWKLQVHVEKKHPNQPLADPKIEVQEFVVGKPHFQAGGVACRGTRGYVAVRLDEKGELHGPFVYLKDAWRVDHPGIEREGNILQTLNDKKVRFVPTLVCHGDVPGQVTRSQAVWEEANKGKKCRMKKHQHYRIVVAEVGKPLDQFDRGFTLVKAVLGCIMAHAAAYKKAGIIHRDISTGNMLLYKNPQGMWVGLLNDWELAKIVGESSEARQPDRTGTWQYMSAKALNDPSKEIIVPDEIESFFHVLLYLAIRFLPNNLDRDSVGRFLIDYFDGCTNIQGVYRCGPRKLEAMLMGVIDLSTYNGHESVLTFYRPDDDESQHPNERATHPINAIFKTLLAWLKARYTIGRPVDVQTVTPAPAENDRKEMQAMWADIDDDGDDNSTASAAENEEVDDVVDPPSPSPLGPGSSSLPSFVTSPATSAPPPADAEMREDAEKLQSHSKVVEVFRYQLEEVGWPQSDKGPDLKPRTAHAPLYESDPSAPELDGSSYPTSGKRHLEESEPQSPSNKRSRIDGAS